MRKETSNTWSDGLVMDLNPLNTPNTVLSDCLNGTLITYNGNEFHLQNDQGNYKLKHCKLKPNYIPVGLKEYGDILYIVSYNPLEKTVEVGSYPSPLMVSTSEFEPNDQKFGSVIQKFLPTLEPLKYSELVEKEDFMIFNGDEYKLFPGDKYHIQVIDYTTFYKYETFDCYILDEESNTHEIPDNQIVNSDCTVEPLDEDYNYVSWTVPGWITLKSRIAKLTSSDINVHSFYAPIEEGSRTGYFNWTFKVNIDDPIFFEKEIISEENPILRDLAFKLEIKKNSILIYDSVIKLEEVSENNSDSISLTAGEFGSTDWYGNNRIMWKNISGNIPGLKDTDVLTVTMTPMLIDDEYSILYDNISQTKTFDLSEIDNIPWSFGETLYRFYHDVDNTHQIIEFDINGPMVSSSEIKFSYSVEKLNKKQYLPETPLETYYGIGKNILSFPISNDEEIWILKFKFKSKEFEKIIYRYLISTQLLTGTEEWSVYDKEMTLDDLLVKYFDNIEIFSPDIEYGKNWDYWQLTEQFSPKTNAVKSFMNVENKYYTFVNDVDELIGTNISGKVGKFSRFDKCVIKPNVKRIQGSLWDSVLTGVLKNDNLMQVGNLFEENGNVFSTNPQILSGNPFESFEDSLVIFGHRNYTGTVQAGVLTFNFTEIETKELYEFKQYLILNLKYLPNNTAYEYEFSGILSEKGTAEIYSIGRKIVSIFESHNSFEECPYILLNVNVYTEDGSVSNWPAYGPRIVNNFLVFPPGINPETEGYYEFLPNCIVGGDLNLQLAAIVQSLHLIKVFGDSRATSACYLSNKTYDDKTSFLHEITTTVKLNSDWMYLGRPLKFNMALNENCLFQNCILWKNHNLTKTFKSKHNPELTLSTDNTIVTKINAIFDEHSRDIAVKQYDDWVNSTFYKNIVSGKHSETSGIYSEQIENEQLQNLAKMLEESMDISKSSGKYLTKLDTNVDERYVFIGNYEFCTALGLVTKYIPQQFNSIHES